MYSKESQGSHTRLIYYIQKDDPAKYELAIMKDTVERYKEIVAGKIDHLSVIYNLPDLYDIWKTVSRYSKRGTKFDEIINKPIPYESFKSNGNLFIINYLKDSLLTYSEEGRFKNAISIAFHKEESVTGLKYKSLKCMTDPVNQKVYVLEKQLSKWILKPLDPVTGKTGEVVPLPDYPGMDRISVYGNAVYFIYQEKLFSYYSRLYQFQI